MWPLNLRRCSLVTALVIWQALRDTFAVFGKVKDVVLGGLTKNGAKHVAHIVFEDERWPSRTFVRLLI